MSDKHYRKSTSMFIYQSGGQTHLDSSQCDRPNSLVIDKYKTSCGLAESQDIPTDQLVKYVCCTNHGLRLLKPARCVTPNNRKHRFRSKTRQYFGQLAHNLFGKMQRGLPMASAMKFLRDPMLMILCSNLRLSFSRKGPTHRKAHPNSCPTSQRVLL